MWAEFLFATLKTGCRQRDLDRVISWNDEHHRKAGVQDVRYFLSKDRSQFVMMVGYSDKKTMRRLKSEWEQSKAEGETWFREMMSAVFASGRSAVFSEISA